MNALRLANAARAVRETPHPMSFTMRMIAYPCGTPRCVLGNYACRPDLQDEFILAEHDIVVSFSPIVYRMINLALTARPEVVCAIDEGEVCGHFGITSEEALELFGTVGCNSAYRPEEAAAYIEAFIERKLRAEPLPEFIRALCVEQQTESVPA